LFRLLQINTVGLKKVAIFKEMIVPLLDFFPVEQINGQARFD
jgi:hypothetical protein